MYTSVWTQLCQRFKEQPFLASPDADRLGYETKNFLPIILCKVAQLPTDWIEHICKLLFLSLATEYQLDLGLNFDKMILRQHVCDCCAVRRGTFTSVLSLLQPTIGFSFNDCPVFSCNVCTSLLKLLISVKGWKHMLHFSEAKTSENYYFVLV